MTAAAVEYQDDAMEAHEAGLVFQCSCQAGCGTVSHGVHNSSAGSVCQNSEMTTQLPGKVVVYIAGKHPHHFAWMSSQRKGRGDGQQAGRQTQAGRRRQAGRQAGLASCHCHFTPCLSILCRLVAAGIFGGCNFLEGVFSFLAARSYAKHKTSLDKLYGAIWQATKEKVKLPDISWEDFDYWRMWQTIFGFMVIGLGNWLIAKDRITYGLFACTVGAMLLGNGIIGWAESKLAVLRCGREFYQMLLAMDEVQAALKQEEREQFQADLAKMKETLRVAHLHA